MALVLLSALAFVVMITVLILIHELGHFVAARLLGVTVEEFGFGLPPRAITLFKKWGTHFTLNWIPFGGFVRMKGESDSSAKPQAGSFSSVSIFRRAIILTAGVGMNLLLAIFIFWCGFTWGKWIPTYQKLDDMLAAAERNEIHLVLGVQLQEVFDGGGAKSAGIPPGSILVAVDGTSVAKPDEVVELQKGKSAVTYRYLPSPESVTPIDKRVRLLDGKSGVQLRAVSRELSAPVRSPITGLSFALRETKVVTVQTVVGMAKLFSSLAHRGRIPEGVTGIVGIAHLTYESVEKGFMVYLRLAALLSLSLAVLNILPFPALDGGRLMFVLSELVVRPGTRRIEAMTNAIGFAFLILLILLVTIYDIVRLVHR